MTAQTTTFGHLRIAYDERVLRPRPWTELQSRLAARCLDSAPAGAVLELCCGAGHIGLLAVALARARRPLVAVDSSPAACAYALANAVDAGMDGLVEVREARLEDAVAADERFALVIADPPWVPSAQTERFPEDPPVAIDGGPDGLDAARACLRVAQAHLLPGGAVLVQLGDRDQADRLAAEAQAESPAGLETREVVEGERGVILILGRPA